MAVLTAASWTLTIRSRTITGNKKWVEGTLALAGVDSYPDNGIPLPAIGNFGFERSMDGLVIYGVDATTGTVANYTYGFDRTNHKLFVYEEEAVAAGGPLLECDAGEVPGPRTLEFMAFGW